MAEDSTISNRNLPNVVFLIFSDGPRTDAEWTRLTDEIFTSREGWVRLASKVLDVEDSEHGVPNGKGRVYEIQATVPSPASTKTMTVSACSDVRKSSKLEAFEGREAVQIICQPVDLYHMHREPGLAIFDMDSTLIQQEVIDELARTVGRYDQVAAVTEAAMRGELDFEESLRARVKQLKGVSTDIWEKLKRETISFTPGGRELIQALKRLGWKTAVLSGGFTPLACWVRETLGLDYAYANELAIDGSGSALSGELLEGAPIVGASRKKELLEQLAAENSIPLSRAIAVGDGSNDLLMIHTAGLGIAFNAKPKVQQAAPARLNSSTLLDIMYVLGFTKGEITKILGLGELKTDGK